MAVGTSGLMGTVDSSRSIVEIEACAAVITALVYHSSEPICLALSPSTAKLVSWELGAKTVASFASVSASSLPGMSVWPGTQCNDTLALFSAI